MNRFNKGKLLGIVAASLSGVSLIGVGFATWVIGTKTTTDTRDVSIVADDVKYQSLKVSVTFTGGIRLAETGNKLSEDSEFNYTGEPKGNLTVDAVFTFTIGKDFVDKDFTDHYDMINFTLADTSQETNKDDYVDNTVAESAVFTRTDKTGLTYFELPDAVTDFGTLTFTQSEDGLTKTASTKSISLQFKWGSLFGNTKPITGEGTSPMHYYSNTMNASSFTGDKDEYMKSAYQELDAMKTKYGSSDTSSKKLKLQISLGKKKA